MVIEAINCVFVTVDDFLREFLFIIAMAFSIQIFRSADNSPNNAAPMMLGIDPILRKYMRCADSTTAKRKFGARSAIGKEYSQADGKNVAVPWINCMSYSYLQRIFEKYL